MLKPFASIPGPKGLFGFTLPYYLINKIPFSFDKLHRNGFEKRRRFGNLVRERIAPGAEILWIFRPEDVKKMFEAEGECPSRRSHLALGHYRLNNRDKYANAGLLPTNGPEWARIRRQFQFRPDKVDRIQSGIEEIAADFVRMIGKKGSTVEMLSELKKYYLEVTALFLFGSRLGAVRPDLRPDSVPSLLMQAAMDTNDNILKTDNGLQVSFSRNETESAETLCSANDILINTFMKSKCNVSWHCSNPNRNVNCTLDNAYEDTLRFSLWVPGKTGTVSCFAVVRSRPKS